MKVIMVGVEPKLKYSVLDDEPAQAAPQIDLLHGGVGASPAAAMAPATSAAAASVTPTYHPEEATRVVLKKPARGRQLLLALAVLGGVSVLAAGGWLMWQRAQHQVVEQAPVSPPAPISATTPSQLEQAISTGAEPIGTGKVAASGNLSLSFSLGSSAEGDTVVPEVEVQPVAKSFSGEPTASGTSTVMSTEAVLTVPVELTDGSYHWQARVMGEEGAGEWISYGENAETEADFIIDSTAPAAPALAKVGAEAVSGTTATSADTLPALSGTAEPGATITISTSPATFSLSAKADEAGNWTATPTTALTAGTHNLTIAAADSAGNSAQSTFALIIGAASQEPVLAATGQPTGLVSLLAAVALALAALGLWRARRYVR